MSTDFHSLGACYLYETEPKYMIAGFRYAKYLTEKVNLLKCIAFGAWSVPGFEIKVFNDFNFALLYNQ